MLRHYRLEMRNESGITRIRSTNELVYDPCEVCGEESVPNFCKKCKITHHHGMFHTEPELLVALCADHGKMQ